MAKTFQASQETAQNKNRRKKIYGNEIPVMNLVGSKTIALLSPEQIICTEEKLPKPTDIVSAYWWNSSSS